jgi:hypothetical protein
MAETIQAAQPAGETTGCRTPIKADPSKIGRMKKIPAPKTGSWLERYGSWEGFCQAAHRSIGRDLGGGVVTFAKEE